jgi:hypothetical protein
MPAHAGKKGSSGPNSEGLLPSCKNIAATLCNSAELKPFLRTITPPKFTLDTNPPSLHTTNLYIDNSGAIEMSTANGPTRRSKDIDFQHHFTNGQVQNGQIRPVKVSTLDQKADLFTSTQARQVRS